MDLKDLIDEKEKQRIEKLSDNNLEFYGIMISLLLLFSSIFIHFNWFDNEIAYNISLILLFLALVIYIYSSHFKHVKPVGCSIILTLIVTFLIGIIEFVYIKFFKEYTGISLPILLISQNVISNFVKDLFKIQR